MISSTASSLCSHEETTGIPFRHHAGGGYHHRWPSSSSLRPPWRGGSSPPTGLRVCTGSYVFNLSLSHVVEMSRSWCIAGFVNVVGSCGVFPSLSCCDELSFPFEISLLSDWILLWIWEHLIYVLQFNTRGDNGVSYWFSWYVLALNSRIPHVTMG